MNLRITLYENFPITRDGIYAPRVTGYQTRKSLDQHLHDDYNAVEWIIPDRGFNPNQRSIGATPYSLVANCNFCRISTTAAEEGSEGTNYDADIDPHYYYVDDVIPLSPSEEDGMVTEPCIVNITEDSWLVDFWQETAAGWSIPRTVGRIGQSTINNETAVRGLPCARAFNNKKTYIVTDIGEQLGDDWRVFITFVTESGRIMYGCNLDDTLPASTLYKVINKLSQAAQVIFNGDMFGVSSPVTENISILGIYALPAALLGWGTEIIAPSSVQKSAAFRLELGDTVLLDLGIVGSTAVPVGGLGADYPPPWTYTRNPYTITGVNAKYARSYLCTPSHRIEEQGIKVDKPVDISVQVRVPMWQPYSQSGAAADTAVPVGISSIPVTLWIDGEAIDIGEDFAVPFAVNEQARNNAQFTADKYLGYAADIIGGAGGIVGGIATGNWFGAAQALTSGAAGVVGRASEEHRPATMQSAGGGLIMQALPRGGIWEEVTPASNVDEITALVDVYGWVYPAAPRAQLAAGEIEDGTYIQYAELDAVRGVGVQSTPAQEIAEKLKRGVIFVDV